MLQIWEILHCSLVTKDLWVNPAPAYIPYTRIALWLIFFPFFFLPFLFSSFFFSFFPLHLLYTYMCQYITTRSRPGWGWVNLRPSSKRNCSTATGSLAGVRAPLVWWPVPTQIMTCSRWPADLAVLLKMLSSCCNTWIASFTWRPWRSIKRSCTRASRAAGFLQRNIQSGSYYFLTND